MDFTLTTYKKLLQELLANGYSFQTLRDFIQQPKPVSGQFWELATDTHRLTQTGNGSRKGAKAIKK